MRFLNPKTDFAFKRIFGSERSHDILLSFLNAILGLQSPYRIVALTLLDMTEDDALIAAKTGLPIDKVRQLRDAS